MLLLKDNSTTLIFLLMKLLVKLETGQMLPQLEFPGENGAIDKPSVNSQNTRTQPSRFPDSTFPDYFYLFYQKERNTFYKGTVYN